MKNNITNLLAGSATLQTTLQRFPEILSVILIAGCSYTLATITWGLLPEGHDSAATPAIVSYSAPKTNSTQLFRQLSNAHLFGVASKQTNSVPTSAPVTKLNYVLKGVLATEPMSLASAIIAQRKGGPEDIYGIGDKLPGNVTIEEIHPDHVILKRNGQLETLKLPEESGNLSFTASASNTRRSNTSGKQSLKGVRDQILKDPTSFGDYALPIVVKERGKQIGYRLDFQAKGEVFTAAGLKSTDVITSINGIALNTPQKSMRALRGMRAAKQLNLVVSRNGADVRINLQLQ